MKNINKWLIIAALVINQLNWPVAALAQTVTDTPSNTPTDQPTPAPATDTPAPTTTNAPTPSSNPSPTTDPASPTPTTSSTITPTPDPSGTISPTPSIDPNLSPIPSIIPTISPIPTGTITGVDPVAPQTIIVVTNNNSPSPNNNSSNNSGSNTSNNDPSATNNGTSNTNAQASSQTGGNQISTPDASHRSTDTINTGDATAYGNLINMVNTNNINSNVKVYLLNNLDGTVNQIDLNSMWQLLASGQPTNLVTVDASNDPNNQININNNGSIQNQLAVNAGTGNNQIATNGKASIATGNAYALANVINMLNSTFVNSKIFIGVLNLNGSTLGDLILPGPQNFAPTGNAISGSNIGINNQATIGNDVATTADTGNNTTSNTRGNTLVNTGNATSLSNVMNDSNMNLINAASLILALNALGNWTGNVYNWGTPGSVMPGSSFSNLFSTGAMAGNGSGNNSFLIAINNQAYIYNQVAVSALTGNNSTQSYGSTTINTGNAWAVANIANLANLNAIGSNYFYGVVNIVGNWNGNVIFAYPDLALSMGMSKNQVHNGDSVTAMVDYNNIGYDQANGVQVTMNLPDGVTYQGDDSGVTPTNNGHNLTWNFGNDDPKQDKKFDVNLKVDESGVVTASLIKPVMAADNTLTITANVSTLKTEVTTDNNSASGQLQVVDGNSDASSNDNGTTLWPNLRIWVNNNVNDFVYPGDVVTFQVDGKNEGDAEAYGTYLHQVLEDANGNVLADMDINIGDVPVDHAGKVTFGMPLNYQFTKDQIVTSYTTWIGHTEKGDNTQSGTATTTFQVKTHHSFHLQGPVTPVQAVNIDPNILGAATSQAIKLGDIDILPYLLLFIASMIWLISKMRTNTFYKKNWLKITGSILIILFMFGCFLYSGLTLYKNSQAVLTFVKTLKI